MENIKINCCFCKKEIKFLQSHDISPITTTNKNNRCCLECNNTIVCPTRSVVWNWETKARWVDEILQKENISQNSTNPLFEYISKLKQTNK